MKQDFLKLDWPSISQAFEFNTDTKISPLGNGHINDTYKLSNSASTAGNDSRRDSFLVLQRINHEVFTRPHQVQENFNQVSLCLAQHAPGLIALTPISTLAGEQLLETNKRFWRVTSGVGNSRTVEQPSKASEAYWAAHAFGQFDAATSHMSPNSVHDVIPDFHNLNFRLSQLEQAVSVNPIDRLKSCQDELALAESLKPLASWLPKAAANNELRLQVVHNDTKINNALLSADTGEALAVIDLDTVMKGYCVTDYGDMVRSFTPNQAEDSTEEVEIQWHLLEALTQGYLDACGNNLLKSEKQALLLGAEWMSGMLATRFLTDYINGDHYFKTDHERQNLDRSRNQYSILKHLRRERNQWQKQLGL